MGNRIDPVTMSNFSEKQKYFMIVAVRGHALVSSLSELRNVLGFCFDSLETELDYTIGPTVQNCQVL